MRPPSLRPLSQPVERPSEPSGAAPATDDVADLPTTHTPAAAHPSSAAGDVSDAPTERMPAAPQPTLDDDGSYR
jgi:hypothetical protein